MIRIGTGTTTVRVDMSGKRMIVKLVGECDRTFVKPVEI
jgi:hypothetical protein